MNENLETKNLIPCEEEVVEIAESSGNSVAVASLAIVIVSGLAIATIIGGKKLKKVWDKHKAKKNGCIDNIDNTNSDNVVDVVSEYVEED